MKKEDYEKLYEEYKILKVQIDDTFQVRQVIPGRPIEVKIVPPMKDMYRYHEIKEILARDGKDFLDLNPSDWYEITENL